MLKNITKSLWMAAILLAFGAPFQGYAQFADARTGSNSIRSAGKSVASNRNDESFVTGFFGGVIDFVNFGGPVWTSSFGAPAAYVLALDPGGNHMWSAMIESDAGGSFGEDIIYDPATGYTYVTGRYEGNVYVYDNSMGLVAGYSGFGGEDVFVVVFDPGGNFINLVVGGGPGDDGGEGLTTDASNPGQRIGCTGYFTNDIAFFDWSGSFLISTIVAQPSGTRDIFLTEFGMALGGASFIADVESPGDDAGYGVGVNSMGEYYVAGTIHPNFWVQDAGGGVSGPFFPATGGGSDGLLTKFRTGGIFGWVTVQASPGDDESFDVVVTSAAGNYDGFCVVTGRYMADLFASDPGLNPIIPVPHNCPGVINELFVVGYDINGNPLWGDWVESCGGTTGANRGAIGHSLSYQGQNWDVVYVGGQVEGQSNFFEGALGGVYPLPTPAGIVPEDVESVVLRIIAPYAFGAYSGGLIFAENGNPAWYEMDPAYGISVSDQCSVFLTGRLSGPNADFAPFVLNPGTCGGSPCIPQMYWANLKCWSFKKGLQGNVSEELETIAGVAIYPNPGNGLVWLGLENPAAEGSSVRVMDVQGRIMLNETISQSFDRISLDLTHLASGMYWVEVNRAGLEPVRLKYVKE